jgi:ABC-type transport system substrate-binding protein
MKQAREGGTNPMTDERRFPWQSMLGTGKVSRRDFVKRSVALGIALPTVSTLLAACGGDDDEDSPTSVPAAQATATQPITVDQNATPTAAAGATAAPSGATTAPAATATTPAATGSTGGTVTLARQVDSENLDPVIQDGNINIWVFMSMYDQLISVADDGVGLSPRLAESWDISEDGTEYTFTLRGGVKFSDGSDMTVDDVKWSIERARRRSKPVVIFAGAGRGGHDTRRFDRRADADRSLGAVPGADRHVQRQHHFQGVRGGRPHQARQ